MNQIPSKMNSAQEAVINPSHYSEGRKYEPIEVIKDWNLDFDLGNTVKYISRAGRKDQQKTFEDLEKAAFYLLHEMLSVDGESTKTFINNWQVNRK